MALEDDFMRFMSCHLVPLVYQCDVENDGVTQQRTGYVSGFVIYLHGQFFWATAGHCLSELDATITSGEVKLVGTYFADYFGSGAKHQHMVPFPYEPNDALKVEDASLSLDYALLPLNSLVVQAFDKNGIKAVARENWVALSDQGLTFSDYKMLGFPRPAQALDCDNEGLRPVMIAIERIPNQEFLTRGDDWFVGRIHDAARISDIAGMSGGPIFGFRKVDRQWSYHVVALQNSWIQSSRIIKGCSLPYFAEALHSVMEEFAQNPDETGEPVE